MAKIPQRLQKLSECHTCYTNYAMDATNLIKIAKDTTERLISKYKSTKG